MGGNSIYAFHMPITYLSLSYHYGSHTAMV
nr:MAG TPA: hypothetical protein [Caudoviricetes sp.]